MQRNDEGIIEKVFSKTGDAALPDTYEAGFVPATSTPGSGVFPKRTDFNFLFKALTALAADINRCGCLLPWDGLVNYYLGARVTGSNGKIYLAMVANGPATANAKDPTASQPTPAIWALSPEYSLGTMAQQNANAVAITGGTINGTNLNTLLAALGTLANQNADDVTITGGNIIDSNIGACQIDNTVIGANTPATAVFTKAVDNGVAPTLPAQLANKAYVDPAVTSNSNGICYKLPGGLKLRIMHVTAPSSGNSETNIDVTFPVAFTDTNYVAICTPNNKAGSTPEGNAVVACQNKTQTGCHFNFDTNGAASFTQAQPATVFLFGV